MGWTIKFDARAIRDLNKLDRGVRRAVFDYVRDRIGTADNPRDFGKPLRHDKAGLWRYRVGDHRIVCDLRDADRTILIVAIGHRRSVYD